MKKVICDSTIRFLYYRLGSSAVMETILRDKANMIRPFQITTQRLHHMITRALDRRQK